MEYVGGYNQAIKMAKVRACKVKPDPDYDVQPSVQEDIQGAVNSPLLSSELLSSQDRKPRQFDTRPPPNSKKDFNPTSEHEEAIHRLRDHHAKLHGLQPRGFLTHREDLERIAKVLDEYGEPACMRIIEGHKRLCDQGKESKDGFVFAFPWSDKESRSEPDWDWIAQHAAAKKKPKHHTQSEVDETPEQRYRRQQAEEKAREAAMTPEERAKRAEEAEAAV